MSKLFYDTHRTYDYAQSFPDKPNWESLTVPDQVLSLREIINRYSRGQALPPIGAPNIGNLPIDTSDFDHADKFDKLTAARAARARAQSLDDELTLRKATVAKYKAEKAFDRAVAKKAAAMIKPSDDNQQQTT